MFRIQKETLVYFGMVVLLSLVFFFPGWLPDHTFIMTDFLTAAYPFHKLTGKLPLPEWDPYIFGGMPFWGAPHADMFYINQIFRFFVNPGYAAAISMLFHSLWAYLFMYLYLRKIGIEKPWAFSLGALYSTATFWTSLVFSGHIAKMSIICNIPAIFWAIEGLLEGKLKYSALLGLFAGVSLNAGHAQLMYYVFIAAAIYSFGGIVNLLIKRKYLHACKVVALGTFSLGLAVLISSPFLWNQMEYIRGFSLRGETKDLEFARSWSLDWADFFSMFFGMYSGVFERYWGSNPFKINSEYIGAIPVILATVGTILKLRTWRVLSLSVAAFILFIFMTAKVNPLFPLLYNFFPMIKLFRAQSMASGAFGFVVFAIAGHFFKDVEKSKEVLPKVLVGFAVAGLILIMFPKSFTLWGMENDIQRQAIISVQSGDRFLSVAKTIFAGLVILMFFGSKTSIKNISFSMVVVGFVDNYISRAPFYKPIVESVYFAPDDVAKFFQNNKGIYRVVDISYKPDDNYLVLFGVQFVGGHHGQQMKTYQKYLQCKGLMFNPFACEKIINTPEVLDTLGVKYVIVPAGFKEQIGKYVEFAKFSGYIRKYKTVFKSGDLEIMENPDYFPRAFLLCGDSVYKFARFINYDPRRGYYRIKYTSPSSCNLVITENYYPHWQSRINGKPQSVKEFRETFMSVKIGRGEGFVEFIYKSSLEKITVILFFMGLLLSIGLAFMGLLFRI